MIAKDSHVLNANDVRFPVNMHFPTGQFVTKHGSTVKVPIFKDYNRCVQYIYKFYVIHTVHFLIFNIVTNKCTQ
jgi:hypothetical protein